MTRVEALARFAMQIVAGLIPGCPSFSWLASTVQVHIQYINEKKTGFTRLSFVGAANGT